MVLIETAMSIYLDCNEAKLYNEFWPADRYRSFDEMKKNISAMFYNGHWTDSKAIRPSLPNEVEIGGIQIKGKPSPLEADLQKFLDEATNGVIVWTFGSNVPIAKIDPEKLDIMLKVLGKQKERVILRWEGDENKLPANFLGKKWLAQDSVLGK